MPAPAKISEKQWIDIERRSLAGESNRSLAKEYGVSEGAIRKRIGTRCKNIKAVAQQIVNTERLISTLPEGAQIKARTLAERLMSISEHGASAAEYGMMTAHKLTKLAHTQANKLEVDENVPVDNVMLASIMALQQTANEAAKTGIKLIEAGRDMLSDRSDESGKEQKQIMVFKIPDNGR